MREEEEREGAERSTGERGPAGRMELGRPGRRGVASGEVRGAGAVEEEGEVRVGQVRKKR